MLTFAGYAVGGGARDLNLNETAPDVILRRRAGRDAFKRYVYVQRMLALDPVSSFLKLIPDALKQKLKKLF